MESKLVENAKRRSSRKALYSVGLKYVSVDNVDSLMYQHWCTNSAESHVYFNCFYNSLY